LLREITDQIEGVSRHGAVSGRVAAIDAAVHTPTDPRLDSTLVDEGITITDTVGTDALDLR
jgi:hypothetical protein